MRTFCVLTISLTIIPADNPVLGFFGQEPPFISNHRIPDLPSLQSLLKPWAAARNAAQKGVDWQFTTDDARTKLKHLYPIIKI